MVQTLAPATVKPQEQMAPVRFRSESSAARHQPASDPFLLVSTGPAADHHIQSCMFGLYRKTEQMTEGAVSTQEQDSQSRCSPANGETKTDYGWCLVMVMSTPESRHPSDGPTSVKWRYYDYGHGVMTHWPDSDWPPVRSPVSAGGDISLSRGTLWISWTREREWQGLPAEGSSAGRPVLQH